MTYIAIHTEIICNAEKFVIDLHKGVATLSMGVRALFQVALGDFVTPFS